MYLTKDADFTVRFPEMFTSTKKANNKKDIGDIDNFFS